MASSVTVALALVFARAARVRNARHAAHHLDEDDADELDDTHVPEEFEYRYPGPRPQTREAAILMLSDGIESATRTLAEPTPARIEALVRAMANKRLMDGQFEECDITLKDLNLIVDSISRTLTSIYHGRVVYPGAGRGDTRVEKTA
mgnify:CR=1 FL=1